MNISVVVTILNEEKTIERLLDSLVTQTKKPYEVIMVDGGSSDSTVELLQAYVSIFAAAEIKLLLLQKKGNRSVGRNHGITKANSEWIAVTDAGCVPHQDWLEELSKTAQSAETRKNKTQSQLELVVAGYYDAETKTHFERAVVPYVLVMPDKVDPQTFLPATRSVLMNRFVWQKIGGFDESLSDNEDYAFAQKVKKLQAKNEAQIVFARKALVTWLPRSSLMSFAWMIFRFARGDIKAGIVRPKVILIFARYILLLLVSLLLALLNTQLLLVFWILGLAGYTVWAVIKNMRYVGYGWYWLPILQIISDWAVMIGSIAGKLQMLNAR